MKHTYLFQELTWQGEGTYCSGQGTQGKIEGSAKISHKDGEWVLDSQMALCGPNKLSFNNLFHIKPFQNDLTQSEFYSFNSSLGELKGKIIMAMDSMLLYSHSEDNNRVVIEDIRQVNNNSYVNHGALIVNGDNMGSWVLNLSCEQKLRLV